MPSIRFDQGYVSARGRESLQDGELQSASGCYYKRGDNRLWKQGGRSAFASTGSGAEIKGMAFCKFDAASDLLVAMSGTSLYKSAVGSTGAFTEAATSLSANADRLEAAHANDRWYLANGADTLRVLTSDGAVRTAGASRPDAAPGVTTSNASYTVERPTVESSTNFTNTGNAVDTDEDSSSAGTADADMVLSGWSTSTGTDRFVSTSYSVDTPTDYVTVKIELSENAGVGWSTIAENVHDAAAADVVVSSAIADGTAIADVKIRITVTESSSAPTSGGTWPGDGGPFRETF